jgi:transposase-like protein
MTESNSNLSGAEGGNTICPICDSGNTESVGGGVPDLDYRCRDCGAEFDPTGGRVNVE